MGKYLLYSVILTSLLTSCGQNEETPPPPPPEQQQAAEQSQQTSEAEPTKQEEVIEERPATPEENRLVELARKGNLREIKKLLQDENVEIFALDDSGQNIIIAAAANKEKKVLEYALERLTNPLVLEIKDKEGGSAMLRAVATGDVEIVQMLKVAGANTNVYDENLGAPLFMAMEKNNTVLIKTLLTQSRGEHAVKPDPNIVDKNGNNAILLAVHQGKKDIIRLLASLGTSPDMEDKRGITPLLAAIAADNREMKYP